MGAPLLAGAAQTTFAAALPNGTADTENGMPGTCTVKRPTEPPDALVNHSAPSGPRAMPRGPEMIGSVKCVTAPAGVIRPIERLPAFVNHSAPSGPTAMPCGAEMLASVKCVSAPAVVMRPI